MLVFRKILRTFLLNDPYFSGTLLTGPVFLQFNSEPDNEGDIKL